MNTFRKLKDTNNMAKTRLRKLSITGKYYGMEKSNPDKTNFKRPPYYLTVRKGPIDAKKEETFNAAADMRAM